MVIMRICGVTEHSKITGATCLFKQETYIDQVNPSQIQRLPLSIAPAALLTIFSEATLSRKDNRLSLDNSQYQPF